MKKISSFFFKNNLPGTNVASVTKIEATTKIVESNLASLELDENSQVRYSQELSKEFIDNKYFDNKFLLRCYLN